MSDEGRRLYGEKDVSRILKRATEIQGDAGSGETHGLTLAELQQIAREAGISPEAVAAAAAEMGTAPEKSRDFHVLGGPVSFTHERVVAGEVSEETWEAMLDEVRKTYRVIGTSSKVGRSFEWTFSERAEQAQVAVTSREGRVKIRVMERNVKTTMFTFMPVLWALIFMVGFMAEGALVWPVALVAAVFVAARFAFAAITSRKERKARQLLQRLEQLVEPPAPSSAKTASATAEAEPPAAEGRVPLPGLTATDDEADAWDRLPERRRSRS